LINSIAKKDFLGGQKIITENTNEEKLYIILKGTCTLACTQTYQKFKDFQREEDPTLVLRESEKLKNINPNANQALRNQS
jgi:hypothetical protein